MAIKSEINNKIPSRDLTDEAIIRRFYRNYGYFEAMSEFNLKDSFIAFLEIAYDVFDGIGCKFKIQEIIDKVWENEYELKDDIDMVGIAEEIEQMFRYRHMYQKRRVIRC